jgi:hypothetical protein
VEIPHFSVLPVQVTKVLTHTLSFLQMVRVFAFAKLLLQRCNKVSRIEHIKQEQVNDLGVITKCEHDEIKIIGSI